VKLHPSRSIDIGGLGGGALRGGGRLQRISTMFPVKSKNREDKTLFRSPNTAKPRRGDKKKGWLLMPAAPVMRIRGILEDCVGMRIELADYKEYF
jgi:hypothetical protein